MLDLQCFSKEQGVTTTLPTNHQLNVRLIFGFYQIWLNVVRFQFTLSCTENIFIVVCLFRLLGLPLPSSFLIFWSLLCNLCPPQVDDEPFPKFTFVKESCEVYNGMINWSILEFEVLNPRQRFQFVCCTRRHDARKGGLLPCHKMMFSWVSV